MKRFIEGFLGTLQFAAIFIFVLAIIIGSLFIAMYVRKVALVFGISTIISLGIAIVVWILTISIVIGILNAL
jgi:hypothetical protein